MKNRLFAILVIFICFLLQSTVFHYMSFGGVVPNLLMIVTASYGFMGGEIKGLSCGFLCGVLLDIFFGEAVGFYSLVYSYTGYMNGRFNRIFFPEDLRLPMTLIAVSDIFWNLACYVVLFLLRGRFSFGYYLFNILIPEMLYTVVIAIFLYPLLMRIERKMDDAIIHSKYKKTINYHDIDITQV